jgi:3-deoxy-manno-octulosonate cytidylyltransferase (CMP-KDO synthetase)
VFLKNKKLFRKNQARKSYAPFLDSVGVIAVIPARYDSLRFPGKPLAEIRGKPVIWHVVQRTTRAETVDKVIVATDDERIARCVSDFGGDVVMTSKDHPSGTDRIGEAVSKIACDIVVNVQGDEPAIRPWAIDAAITPLLEDKGILMSTLSTDITDIDELTSPNVVKVITDMDGYALYFSRSPIPGSRERKIDSISPGVYKKHIGLYVYRSDFLSTYVRLSRTPLEIAEDLEQLRVLENGYRIKVVHTRYDAIGVDTPQDLDKIERLVAEGKLVL